MNIWKFSAAGALHEGVHARPVLADEAADLARARHPVVAFTDATGLHVLPQRVGARIAVLTHLATDAALSETIAALDNLDAVTSVASVLRMEGAGE